LTIMKSSCVIQPLSNGVEAEATGSLPARCSHRETDDDFFCLRYQVWYPSVDCAFRTKFRTSAGCCDCQQGRFNFKRHSDALRDARFGFPLD